MLHSQLEWTSLLHSLTPSLFKRSLKRHEQATTLACTIIMLQSYCSKGLLFNEYRSLLLWSNISYSHLTLLLLLARLLAHTALAMSRVASAKSKAAEAAAPSSDAVQPADKGKATQDASPLSSAAQPAGLPLHELNTRSAQF